MLCGFFINLSVRLLRVCVSLWQTGPGSVERLTIGPWFDRLAARVSCPIRLCGSGLSLQIPQLLMTDVQRQLKKNSKYRIIL